MKATMAKHGDKGEEEEKGKKVNKERNGGKEI
jgi:hypothetical protein